MSKFKRSKFVDQPKRDGQPWLQDQVAFDHDGTEPTFRSANKNVPRSYQLDLEFVCYTNAENLERKSRGRLKCVEGRCRLVGPGRVRPGSWGNHAWCVTRNGRIVDPYFEWKFPGMKLEYQEHVSDD